MKQTIEDHLLASQRQAKPTIAQKQAMWERIELPQSSTSTQKSKWWIFVLPIVPIAATVGLIVWFQTQSAPSAPIAVVNTNQNTNTVTAVAAIQADPISRWSDIAARGGDPGLDYSAITWEFSDAEPTIPNQVNAYKAKLVSLETADAIMDVVLPNEKTETTDTGFVRSSENTSDCQTSFYSNSIVPCITISNYGHLLYWAGDTHRSFADAQQIISVWSGVEVEQFNVVELPTDEDAPQIQEYYIYVQPQSPNASIALVEVGWQVAMQNQELVGIRTNLLPKAEIDGEVALQSVADAEALLFKALADPNPFTNESASRVVYSMTKLNSIVTQVAQPRFQFETPTLVYVPTEGETDLGLYPAYHFHGQEAQTKQDFDLYIDASAEAFFTEQFPVLSL